MHSRPLIGLVTNDLVGTYQHTFWSGMRSAAAEEDCDLASFNGGEIGSRQHDKSMRRSAFDLIRFAKPDALVLLSTAITNSGDQSRMDVFLRRLGKIPLVSVGFTLPGHPAVLLDNIAGMSAVVEHLVVHHGRRRFAYLGGPNFNPDARERREVFLGVLERHGLKFDPLLEATASWDFALAKEKVRALLDTEVPFDALVAANDDMALGAIEALRERGRRVPEDVVVSGFDDSEEGAWTAPGLTSVRQPVFEQGRAALRLALERLEEGAPNRTETVRTILVPRGSCGCRSGSLLLVRQVADAPRAPAGPPGGAEHLAAVREACEEMAGGSRQDGALAHLVAGLVEGARTGDDVQPLEAFSLLMDLNPNQESSDHWQDFLTRLRQASLPFHSAHPEQVLRLDTILHELRLLAHESTVRAMARRALDAQRKAREIHETGLRLLQGTDLPTLAEILCEQARTLRIASLQVLLHDRSPRRKDCRVLVAVRSGVRCETRPGRKEPLSEAVHAILRSSGLRSAQVVEPLYFGEEHLGWMILEPGARLGLLLDSLRGQLSAALHAHRERQPAGTASGY